LTDFAGCLVSHAHKDHCLGAKEAIKAGLAVYGSAQSLADAGIASYATAYPVEDGQEFATEEQPSWRAYAFGAKHDAEGTLGFLVEAKGEGRLLYLTDTAYSKVTFRGVTHWAVEANFCPEIMRERQINGDLPGDRFSRTTRNHMSIDRAIRLLKSNDLSHAQEIWLIHLSDEHSDADAFRKRVMAEFGIPTFVAPKHSSQASGFYGT